MHSLKNQSFFSRPSSSRPSSRPTSPGPNAPSRPDSGLGGGGPVETRSRPLHKLSLSTFRRPSPSPAPAAAPAPLVRDGSYLETLSLKLSEAVSKALAQNEVAGIAAAGPKRPIPPGRGAAFGALIAIELRATRDNTHLHRAIVRSLHRPLSVFLSNLSSQLSPLLTSPSFADPSAPTVATPNPNNTQLHALSLATLAGELLETFKEFGLGTDADGLKGIREGLFSVVRRVVQPLVNGIKNELTPLIDALETTPLTSTSAKPHKPGPSPLPTLIPIYARAMHRYISTPAAHQILASFLISVVWRGLIVLAHARRTVNPTPPASPHLLPINPIRKKRGGSPPAMTPATSTTSTTPPITPPPSRFNIKLPVSRPPSPPGPVTSSLSVGSIDVVAHADAKTLYDLLNLFPRPDGSEQLAKEAVDEAFEGLRTLAPFMDAARTLPVKAKNDKSSRKALAQELVTLAWELPTLVALPVLLNVYDPSVKVFELIGMNDEEEYRVSCLSGFGRADECADIVGERALDVLEEMEKKPGPVLAVIIDWLEADLEEAGGGSH